MSLFLFAYSLQECDPLVPFLSEDGTCVDHCSWPYPFQDDTAKTCTANCTTSIFEKEEVKVGENTYTVGRCISADTCKEMNQTRSSDFGGADHYMCFFGSCDQTLNKYFMQTVDGAAIGMCVNKCSAPKRIKDAATLTCVEDCPTKVFVTQGVEYFCWPNDTCLEGARKVSTGEGHFTCLPPCQTPENITLTNMSCGAKCANPSREVIYNMKCDIACNAIYAPFALYDEKQDQYFCVSKCPPETPEYTLMNGGLWETCVKCDLETKVIRKWENSSTQCLDECIPDMEYLNVSDRRCLTQCPKNTFVYDRKCMEACPEHYTPGINNECVYTNPENQANLTWLWILLGVAGGIVGTCIVALIITAMKKKKIDLVLADQVKTDQKEL